MLSAIGANAKRAMASSAHACNVELVSILSRITLNTLARLSGATYCIICFLSPGMGYGNAALTSCDCGGIYSLEEELLP